MAKPAKQTTDWTTMEGTPFPLGATWVEEAQAWNFALYSKDAEEVTLLLYAESDLVNPVFTYRFDYLRNKSARIWHCRVAKTLLRGEVLCVFGGRPEVARRIRIPLFRPGQGPSRSLREVGLLPRQLSTALRLRGLGPMPARRPSGCSLVPARNLTGATSGDHVISQTPSSTSCTWEDLPKTRTRE